jgi:hypothetical protein
MTRARVTRICVAAAAMLHLLLPCGSAGATTPGDVQAFFQGCTVIPGQPGRTHSQIRGTCLGHTFSDDGLVPGGACAAAESTPRAYWTVLSCNVDGTLYDNLQFDANTARLFHFSPMTSGFGITKPQLLASPDYVQRARAIDPHAAPGAPNSAEAVMRTNELRAVARTDTPGPAGAARSPTSAVAEISIIGPITISPASPGGQLRGRATAQATPGAAANAVIPESAMRFPAVDVVGLRLGMNESEARALIAAQHPKLKIESLFFGVASLAGARMSDTSSSAVVMSESQVRRDQLAARKKLVDRTASALDMVKLVPPIHLGLQATSGDPGVPINLGLLLRGDSAWERLLDDAGKSSESFWIATGGSRNDTVIDIIYSGAFAEGSARPSVQTLTSRLTTKYGPPSYARAIQSCCAAQGERLMVWLFDDAGAQRGADGAESQREVLPAMFHGSQAIKRPARLEVIIFSGGKLFASGFKFRLLHEQAVAQTFDERRARARADINAWQRDAGRQSPEALAESLQCPALGSLPARPAVPGVGILAVSLGRPLPRFAEWFCSEADLARSPMQVVDSPRRELPWGTTDVELSANPKAFDPALVFMLGHAHVELADDQVRGVRFEGIRSEFEAKLVAALKSQFGQNPVVSDGRYVWTNNQRVVTYVPYDQIETHVMSTVVANSLSLLFGGDTADMPEPQHYGSLSVYTPDHARQVDQYKSRNPSK